MHVHRVTVHKLGQRYALPTTQAISFTKHTRKSSTPTALTYSTNTRFLGEIYFIVRYSKFVIKLVICSLLVLTLVQKNPHKNSPRYKW